MNQKAICIIIIAVFASVLPMSVSATIQAATPITVTQEIDSDCTAPLMSDLTNIISSQSGKNNIMTAKGKPGPAPTPKTYALTLEIDYIDGHQPTQTVLDYIKSYYAKQNIILTINVDDKITMDTNAYSNGISTVEFWNLEVLYNDGSKATNIGYDEYGNYGPQDGVYTSPNKWVLFGTTVEGETNVVGYTLCYGNSYDYIGGNYIYIADQAADTWAGTNLDRQKGAEAVVLMHEFGHSIGIIILRNGGESYCSNAACVMSKLNTRNADKLNQWSYCNNHWSTKNIDYYLVA
jgi:hypothetical protein